MSEQEVLKLIQVMSGLTQVELAARLGVTHATLHRWISGKALPRQAAILRINALYTEYAGGELAYADPLLAKKSVLENYKKRCKNPLKSMQDNPDVMQQYVLSLTYNSNSIEGSTLSEGETAEILFRNATISQKSLVEHLEAKNHQTALQYLFQSETIKYGMSEELILRLHGILMNSIRDDAGVYRRHGVRIVGSYVPTANYLKVPTLMTELVSDIRDEKGDAVTAISNIHSRFEQIHPFSDGNGRVGRMLIYWMLLRRKYPPAVILQKKRRSYYKSLNRAQLQGDMVPLEDFMCDAIIEGYRIILDR